MARIKIGNVRQPIEDLKQFFAPAGYGLGVKNGHDCTDCNEAILNGAYYVFGESAVNHPGHSMQYGCLFVYRRGSYITQVIHYDYYEAKRYSNDGGDTWGAWEWVNPPMQVGIEYRTTERWQGKPVYAKLISFKLSGSTSSNFTVPHGVTGLKSLVRQTATLQSKFPLPYIHNGNTTWVSEVNDTNIVVGNTGQAWDTSYTWVFEIYYTKE